MRRRNEKININTNSWHYYLAARIAGYSAPYTLDGYTYGNNSDLCTYGKYVLGGLLLMILIGCGIAVAGYLFFNVVFGIIFSIICKVYILDALGSLTLLIISTIGLLYCISAATFKFCYYYMAKHDTPITPKPDGFIKNAYKGWKEKFCIEIKFKD